MPVRLDSDPVAMSATISIEPADRDVGARVAHALAALSRAWIAVSDFALGRPTLDEVFLALPGQPAGTQTQTEEKAA